MVSNSFSNVIILTVTTIACLYVVCFFSKVIENRINCIGKVLSYIGRESFYIMVFHFIGFKIASSLLLLLDMNVEISTIVAPAGNSAIILLIYMLFGVGFPLLIMQSFRLAKNVVR